MKKKTSLHARRRFLRRTVGGAGALSLGLAVPGLAPALFCSGRGNSRSLLVVYLRGGADALNMIVPRNDPAYHALRPEIGIGEAGADEDPGLLPLDDRFGLHPAFAALMPYWKEGKLAPVVCTGSPHPTRSHFDAQDFMEYAAPGLRTLKSGWLNRYLAATAAKNAPARLRAVAMQKLLPRSLRGKHPVLAVPDRAKAEVSGVLDEFEDVYGGGEMEPGAAMERTREDEAGAEGVGRETIATLRELYRVIDEDGESTPKVAYPRSSLAAQLQRLARVIKAEAGLEVSSLDWTGFDTHTNQGAGTGTFARRIQDLAESLAAFGRDLGPRLDDTTVLVMSEFGRTCRENGNRGTDHGHGSAMIAFGGGIVGGKVHGKWLGLDDKVLYEGRDLPATTDFRMVFAEVLERFMRFTPPADFFPGWTRTGKLGLYS